MVLGRDAILAAARVVLEREGVRATTMRAVAEELGVSAAALYYHYENKGQLVAALVDRRVEEALVASGTERDWRRRLRAVAEEFRALAAVQPEWIDMLVDTYRYSPALRRLHASGVNVLLEAGFAPRTAMHGYRALMRYVVGHVVVGAGGGREQGGAGPARPAHQDVPGLPPFDTAEQFALGLDLLLDGLERRRDTDGGSS
ncbi:TetR/AcrR family transcriptional regulator [Allonocardiopsis opalescens]|uniref:TetR/AcrR family transcriptional regulator n=1 Tax=Allonocardiopsis opalescens TaxID=1144618 RepID=UPI001474DBFE|nr:TetR/AcrR family transcriptional regulator [Allonocardiopsis opalescens]